MAGDEAGVTLGQPHLSRQDLSTLVRTVVEGLRAKGGERRKGVAVWGDVPGVVSPLWDSRGVGQGWAAEARGRSLTWLLFLFSGQARRIRPPCN